MDPSNSVRDSQHTLYASPQVSSPSSYTYVQNNSRDKSGVDVENRYESHPEVAAGVPQYSLHNSGNPHPRFHHSPSPSATPCAPPPFHYHQYDDNPPTQVEHFSEHDHLNTGGFMLSSNTESGDSVNPDCTYETSSIPNNGEQHQYHHHTFSYSLAKNRNIYNNIRRNLPENDGYRTGVTLAHPPDSQFGCSGGLVLDLSKDVLEQNVKPEVFSSPPTREPSSGICQNDGSYGQFPPMTQVPFDRQPSVIVHTASVSRPMMPDTSFHVNFDENIECGPFQILSTSSLASKHGRNESEKSSSRVGIEEQHLQLGPDHQHQFESILNEIEQKPVVSNTIHMMMNNQPVVGYSSALPVQFEWNGESGRKQQAVQTANPRMAHLGENGTFGTQSLQSAIADVSNQLSHHRHLGSSGMGGLNPQPNKPSICTSTEEYYRSSSSTPNLSSSPSASSFVQYSNLGTDAPYHDGASAAPKSARKSCSGAAGRGRGIKGATTLQNDPLYVHQSGYPVSSQVRGAARVTKPGRGRAKKKVVPVALNVSGGQASETDAVQTMEPSNSVDFDQVLTTEQLQFRLTNQHVQQNYSSDGVPTAKAKRSYKKRVSKTNNSNSTSQAGSVPQSCDADSSEKVKEKRGGGGGRGRKSKSDQRLLATSANAHINANTEHGADGTGCFANELSQTYATSSTALGRGRGTGQGRGRKSIVAARKSPSGRGRANANRNSLMQFEMANAAGKVILAGTPQRSLFAPGNEELPILPLPDNSNLSCVKIDPLACDGESVQPAVTESSDQHGRKVDQPTSILLSHSNDAQSEENSTSLVDQSSQQQADYCDRRKSQGDRGGRKVIKSSRSRLPNSDSERDSNEDDEEEEEGCEGDSKRRTTRSGAMRQRNPDVNFQQDQLGRNFNAGRNVDVANKLATVETLKVEHQDAADNGSVDDDHHDGLISLKQSNLSEMSPIIQESVKDLEDSGQVDRGNRDATAILQFPSTNIKSKKPSTLKKPRAGKKSIFPIRESHVSNIGGAVKGKRGQGKRSLERQQMQMDVEIESARYLISERVQTGTKLVLPKYSEEEKHLVYADRRFVIDLNHVDMEPDQIFIWQILESEHCLRQFYPSKYGQKQFFISSPVKWYFFEEEFKSEEFYTRFVPIVVVVASELQQPIRRANQVMTDTHAVVQYIHVDKIFFNRMIRCVARIDTTEELRSSFMTSLPVMTLLALDSTFLHTLNRTEICSDEQMVEKYGRMIQSWDTISAVIVQVVQDALSTGQFTGQIVPNLLDYPSMHFSTKNINKKVFCSACLPKNMVPHATMTFPTQGHMEKPYHKDTLVQQTHVEIVNPEPIHMCRACTTSARKLHRLIHFRYHLLKLIKQNIVKDIVRIKKHNAAVTDEILLWIQRTDVSWKNVMFLDFQMTVAEVQAEFKPKVVRGETQLQPHDPPIDEDNVA